MVPSVNVNNVRRAASWAFLLLVCIAAYQIFAPFLVPLAWAVVLAVFFHPIRRHIDKRRKHPNLVAVALVIAVVLVLVLPVTWITPAFVEQTVSLVGQLNSTGAVSTALAWITETWGNLGFSEEIVRPVLADIGRAAGSAAANLSATLARNVVTFVIDVVIMLFALFYLFRDGPALLLLAFEIMPIAEGRRSRVFQEVTDIVSVTLTAGIAVAAVQGTLAGLAFWAVGLSSPVFWGVLSAVLAFIPVVGAWMVWGPAGVALLAQGHFVQGFTLLITGAVLISLADNILRPMLIAGRSQLNALLVLVGLLGGVQAFGFLGLVLGPLIVASGVGFIRGYRESLREARLGRASPDDSQAFRINA